MNNKTIVVGVAAAAALVAIPYALALSYKAASKYASNQSKKVRYKRYA